LDQHSQVKFERPTRLDMPFIRNLLSELNLLLDGIEETDSWY